MFSTTDGGCITNAQPTGGRGHPETAACSRAAISSDLVNVVTRRVPGQWLVQNGRMRLFRKRKDASRDVDTQAHAVAVESLREFAAELVDPGFTTFDEAVEIACDNAEDEELLGPACKSQRLQLCIVSIARSTNGCWTEFEAPC